MSLRQNLIGTSPLNSFIAFSSISMSTCLGEVNCLPRTENSQKRNVCQGETSTCEAQVAHLKKAFNPAKLARWVGRELVSIPVVPALPATASHFLVRNPQRRVRERLLLVNIPPPLLQPGFSRSCGRVVVCSVDCGAHRVVAIHSQRPEPHWPNILSNVGGSQIG